MNRIFIFLRNSRISFLLLLAIFAILNTRTLHSVTRFPADPGYDYVLSGATNGISSWFDLDPYVHFGAHFLSWLASFAPLETQALVLATLVNVLWSVICLAVFVVLNREGFPRFVSILSALALALCPAASESSLANVGNIKWPLLIFALILVSSKHLIRSPKLSCSCIFLIGVTNPLTVILFLPLAMSFISSSKADRKLFMLPALGLLTSFGIQVITVGSSGLSRGAGGVKVLTPWPGMGLFWWFGLVTPTVICVGALFLRSLLRLQSNSHLVTRVAIAAPVLALASHLYGGIGDRYFVAPMVISWIIAIIFISDLGSRLNRGQFLIVAAAALLLFSVPTIKWYNSSWYLTAGPTWSDEVKKAKALCSGGRATVNVKIGDLNNTEIPCVYVSQN